VIDTYVSRLWYKSQKQLNRLGINRIDYLILTHAHFDHAANADRIRKKYNSKVIIQRKEKSYLQSGDNILPKGTIYLTQTIINL
jgi:hydroxyacylglutathione hydrolase